VLKKPSLLIVDDDEDTLETLSDVLQEKGYRIETAKTGEKAIAKAKEHFFNVALIDVRLPGITGIELLRAFRKNHPTMMKIVITGHATLQTAVDAVNLGANAYIMKPIDHERLDQMIKECLAYARYFDSSTACAQL
jgi:DNA-binding NtrC family response regulator